MRLKIVDIPESARVDTFVFPGFKTYPPDLRNGHLLTPKLRDLYAKLWHQEHAEGEIVCSVVKDAIVDGPGLVFDRDLNLLSQTIHQATPNEIEASANAVNHYTRNGLLPYQPGVTLLCEKAGVGNYGHWLIEMLPIAYLNLRHLVACDWRLRLPVASEAMNAVMHDSTELIGVPVSQTDVRLPGPQRYEQLVIVSGLGHHGIYYSPCVIDCMEHLTAAVSPQKIEKVWVSRAGDRRSMTNEPELCRALTRQGWYIAEPSQMSLREQISLFRGARHIAGVNGAGFTNLVFAQPGIRVTAFMPELMPDVFFWMLAGFKQQKYREIRCRQDSESQYLDGWNRPLLLSIDEVLENLA